MAFRGGLRHLDKQVSRNETCLKIPRDRENLRIKSVLHFSLQTTDCYYWNFGVEFCTTLQLSKQSRDIVGVQLSLFVSFFWLLFVFGLDTLLLFLFKGLSKVAFSLSLYLPFLNVIKKILVKYMPVIFNNKTHSVKSSLKMSLNLLLS